jgi:hypothetical protein
MFSENRFPLFGIVLSDFTLANAFTLAPGIAENEYSPPVAPSRNAVE